MLPHGHYGPDSPARSPTNHMHACIIHAPAAKWQTFTMPAMQVERENLVRVSGPALSASGVGALFVSYRSRVNYDIGLPDEYVNSAQVSSRRMGGAGGQRVPRPHGGRVVGRRG